MASYQIDNGTTYRVNGDGERQQLCNFAARIIQETRFIDDDQVAETRLTIEGTQPPEDGKKKLRQLPPVQVTADEYASMTWVMKRWGTRAVILPGNGIKDDLRAAIQITSDPKITTIYRHIGWTKIGGQHAYLHAGGALGPKGNQPDVKIEVPPEMQLYDLTNAPPAAEGAAATLALIDIGPPELIWPLLAGTFAPLFGPVDFAIHVTGRTGTFKSELLSLFASHYGEKMDSRHLPGSWSSTGNALEAQAHIAKNAPFVIDDFVPTGTSYQVKSYQTTADKIIRAQGNQSGRARLTDASSLQRTMYPRGIVLSTGEDTPEGHSVRARMLILEISPDDVTAPRLSIGQAARGKYKGTTAGLIQGLAAKPVNIRPRAQAIRDQSVDVGHSRTPSMLGHLQAVAEQLILFFAQVGAIAKERTASMKAEAWKAILAAGEQQIQFLESADPVEMFLNTVRTVLGQRIAHIRLLNGGVPAGPEMLGWSADQNGNGVMYRSHGPCIGWIDWDAGEVFLDVAVGFPVVKKTAGNDMTMTKQTLTKRLRESGALTRTDDTRGRLTVRITAEQHPRLVLALNLAQVLQTQEKPQ